MWWWSDNIHYVILYLKSSKYYTYSTMGTCLEFTQKGCRPIHFYKFCLLFIVVYCSMLISRESWNFCAASSYNIDYSVHCYALFYSLIADINIEPYNIIYIHT